MHRQSIFTVRQIGEKLGVDLVRRYEQQRQQPVVHGDPDIVEGLGEFARRRHLQVGREILAENRDIRSRSDGSGGSIARGVLDAVFGDEGEALEDRHGEARTVHHQRMPSAGPGEIAGPVL